MPVINPDLPADGEQADAADYNDVINAILAVLNGSIDADNLADDGVSTPKVQDNAITAAKIAAAAQVAVASKGMVQGGLANGRISVSVNSNNITLAIKTLSNTDPSSSDPVYVRIGSTIRTITSALSVTVNAGTNWFGAGGVMFATYEIDYFVYLGYNSTDGVTLGFARIPWARKYGDFSGTNTAETYAAISTITNAVSSDEYELVGRFNAILSASSSYNWSLPGTQVIINRPIFNTRQLQYAPTLSGRFTDAKWDKTAYYKLNNRDLDLRVRLVANTTTPIAGSGEAEVATPFASDTYSVTANNYVVGFGGILDVGTAIYPAPILWNSTTKLVVRNGTSTIAQITASAPMTWTTSDEVAFTARYMI